MKSIGIDEIKNLKFAIQYFQDCYLVSSIGTLSKSKNGSKILSENIFHTNNGFCVKFRNINEKAEDFFVSSKEIDDLVYMDKYLNPIPLKPEYPHNPIIKALEVAMNKLLKKYPSKKPWICRIPSCNEKFEFNKPSNFLEMFTGKKTINLNEHGIRTTLKTKEKESIDIFDKISDNPDSSFVAGTSIGIKKGLTNNHCYSINKADKKNRTIDLFDHRFQNTLTLTYEDAIKKLKFIVGYFNKDLA